MATKRKQKAKPHVHVWNRWWHSGQLIGRRCRLCDAEEYKDEAWCQAEHAKANLELFRDLKGK